MQDARFVTLLCRKWDISCHVKRLSVKSYARRHKLGIEEAARTVRYSALADIARHTGCRAIVTAHHADDQSETVLMNFLRGAGGAGLSGIPPARPLAAKGSLLLLRPLLGFRRREIMAYVQEHALHFRNDPTNSSRDFMRNRIRLEVFPYLSKLFPGVQERLAQSSDLFRQEEDFWVAEVARVLSKTVRKTGPGFTVVLPQLFGYHKALVRRILRRLLPGSTFQDIEHVLRLAQSRHATGPLELSGVWLVSRSGKNLAVRKRKR